MSRAKAQKFLTDALGIELPYYPMGKIDSLDLFGFTELMILQIYRENTSLELQRKGQVITQAESYAWKPRWKNVLDIGANIGLHSILMAKYGMNVDAYEPQPDIFKQLRQNVDANKLHSRITLHQAAVHNTRLHKMKMTVVENNLTGSHLEGFKDSYGPRHTITVKVVNCADLWEGKDFAKIDSEGNEAQLALTMGEETMKHMDCIMEVRNEQNARIIFEHFYKIDVAIWAQKIGWKRVLALSDMPHINREGSIFIGHEPPWPL
jgi:FkbM family methyltransferase